MTVRPSGGNVFADLGFGAEEAQSLEVRAGLMIELTKLIEARGLTKAMLRRAGATVSPS